MQQRPQLGFVSKDRVRASDVFARQAFALMYRVASGDIDANLAGRIMAHPRRHLLVDFERTRQWSPKIKNVYELN